MKTNEKTASVSFLLQKREKESREKLTLFNPLSYTHFNFSKYFNEFLFHCHFLILSIYLVGVYSLSLMLTHWIFPRIASEKREKRIIRNKRNAQWIQFTYHVEIETETETDTDHGTFSSYTFILLRIMRHVSRSLTLSGRILIHTCISNHNQFESFAFCLLLCFGFCPSILALLFYTLL